MFRSFLLAVRPKTLPAALAPVWAGTALAYYNKGAWSLWLMTGTLLSAIGIQIATNLYNDAIDAEKGADTERRLGPTRITASGLVDKEVVLRGALFFLGFATLCSIPLIVTRGWPIVAIGIPSLYLSYGYTGGRYPLAYLGLGELFVFLFFGLIATMGAYYVQTGEWSSQSALLGAIIGGLSCFLIAINNLRDRAEDSSTGKKTLVVCLGASLYKRLMVLIGAHTTLAILGLWWWLELSMGGELVVLLFAWILLNAVLINTSPATLNKHLAAAGILLICFTIAFQGAILVS